MLWIKRNLMVVVGGLLAVGLLAAGLVYLFQARSKSAQLTVELGQTRSDLENIYKDTKNPFPNPTNVTAAKQETERLQTALTQAKRFFTPVPVEKVTGLAFRTFRDNTLAELQKLAAQSGTTLPAVNYGFSFDIVKHKVDPAPDSFPAIPQQMAEVREICKILFKAHVNPLVGIKRAKVSQDDMGNPSQTDYVGSSVTITTNEQTSTMFSPYEVTFHCLSSELAAALEGFNTSPYGFLVKAVQVSPLVEEAPAAAAVAGPINPPVQGNRPPQRPPGRFEGGGSPPPAAPLQPGVPPTAVKPASSDRQAVVLKEKRLKVTLLIYALRTTK
jgi:hypothetical protein